MMTHSYELTVKGSTEPVYVAFNAGENSDVYFSCDRHLTGKLVVINPYEVSIFFRGLIRHPYLGLDETYPPRGEVLYILEHVLDRCLAIQSASGSLTIIGVVTAIASD